VRFRVLGKQFSVGLNVDDVREYVRDGVFDILDKIDKDIISPHLKLDILEKCTSYFRWNFMVHPMPPSWINQHIRPKYVEFIKKWVGGRKCQNTDLYFARKGIGLGLTDITELANECQVLRCFQLKYSRDPLVQDLYGAELSRIMRNRSQTASSHHWKGPVELSAFEEKAKEISGDLWITMSAHVKRRKILHLMKQDCQEKHLDALVSLEMQGSAVRECKPELINDNGFEWTRTLTGLSPKLLSFGVNGITNTLATADNLKRWGYIKVDEKCALCGAENATVTHVLSMCKGALGELEDPFNRIKWRHDRVLEKIYGSVVKEMDHKGYKEHHVDLSNHQDELKEFPSDLLISEQRPDIVFVDRTNRKVVIAELTVPMENRLEASNQLKTEKYSQMVGKLNSYGWKTHFFAFEVSSRGFISSSLSEFLQFVNIGKGAARSLKHAVSIEALECSRRIFNNRKNKHWS